MNERYAYNLNYIGKFAEQRYKLLQRNGQCYIPNRTQIQFDKLLALVGLREEYDYIKTANVVYEYKSRRFIDGYKYEVIE